MSQIRTRRNVTELAAVNFADTINVTTASSALRTTLANITDTAIQELITGNIDFKTTAVQSSSNVVSSPVVLRNAFAESYFNEIGKLQSKTNSLAKQKVAIIKTITNGEYKVKNTEVVSRGIQEVLQSQTPEKLTTSLEKMMNAVQAEHNAVFTETISQVVKKASVATGFTNVQIKQTTGQISVIALNEKGQSIITDVAIEDKTQRVDLVSETNGINDKSCDSILNRFDQELEKAGLKFKKPDVEWKDTVEWMPDNKLPEVNFSKDKTGDVKRNIQQKLKH
ncbi:MAG: hypothetical protein U0V04_07435 [Spirosomataceae bacterium]